MRANHTVLGLCALLGAAGCAHDGHPRQRASVSEVTNKMATGDENAEGKRREHYQIVSHNDALGRGNETNSTLQDTPSASPTTASTQSNDQRAATMGTPSEVLRGPSSVTYAANSTTAMATDTCELDVHFTVDSTRLGSDAQQRLDRVADCMKRKQVDHATIVGQTDPTGTKEHNDKLGLERARVVAEYLKQRGVPEGDIKVRNKLAAASDPNLWPVERNAAVQQR